MRALFVLLAICCVALASGDAPAQQQREVRIALIISNADYTSPELGDYPAARRDARTMRNALRRADFNVTLANNLTTVQMREAVSAFAARLRAAGEQGVGFFYYSGRGVTDAASGRNYLIPVDAQSVQGDALAQSGLAVEQELASVENAGAKAAIIVIDAPLTAPATQNPGDRGLMATAAFSPSLVAFSAQPAGGGDGAYARALARGLAVQGADVLNVFQTVGAAVSTETQQRQQPRFNSGITEQIVLRPARTRRGQRTPELPPIDPNRFALVIGNSDYAPGERRPDRLYLQNLSNANRDADLIAQTLRMRGFDVQRASDVNRQQLRREIGVFAARANAAPPEARAILYYAGHSTQVEATLFLAPVGASVPLDPPVSYLDPWRGHSHVDELVSLPIEAFERRPGRGAQTLIVMDSCRNNPWPALAGRGIPAGAIRRLSPEKVQRDQRRLQETRRALQEARRRARTAEERQMAQRRQFDASYTAVIVGIFDDLPDRVDIALAAEPGSTAADGDLGGNGPFATALARWIGIDGLSTLQLMSRVRRDVMTATHNAQELHFYTNDAAGSCLFQCGSASNPADESYDLSRVPADLRSVVESARQKAGQAMDAVAEARRQSHAAVTDDFSTQVPESFERHAAVFAPQTAIASAPRVARILSFWNQVYINDAKVDHYSGQARGNFADGFGVFRSSCHVVMLRARCVSRWRSVFWGEFEGGRVNGLGMSWNTINGFVSWGEFRAGVFEGLSADPDGTRVEGRFEDGRLVAGVLWTDSGYTMRACRRAAQPSGSTVFSACTLTTS